MKLIVESETNTITYEVKQHRKKITKFAERLRDRASYLLSQRNSLKETVENLRAHMKEIEYSGSIYVSYMSMSEWSDIEGLYIRNSNGDYTLVSITTMKEDEHE
jgi:hypothetical protein